MAVAWAGDSSYGVLPIGAVSAKIFSLSGSAGNFLQLAPKGIGNGVGADHLHFATAYAEPIAYGQSGAFVAKSISADGSATEVQLLASSPNQIGSSWMAL